MSDANDRKDATTPKKGGFGAFSQQYRDRWATNHPDPQPGDVASAPAPAVGEPPADAAAPRTGPQQA